eukprot:980734_1
MGWANLHSVIDAQCVHIHRNPRLPSQSNLRNNIVDIGMWSEEIQLTVATPQPITELAMSWVSRSTQYVSETESELKEWSERNQTDMQLLRAGGCQMTLVDIKQLLTETE